MVAPREWGDRLAWHGHLVICVVQSPQVVCSCNKNRNKILNDIKFMHSEKIFFSFFFFWAVHKCAGSKFPLSQFKKCLINECFFGGILKITWHLPRDTNEQETGQELLIDPFLPSCLVFYCLSPIFSPVSEGNRGLCDCCAYIGLSVPARSLKRAGFNQVCVWLLLDYY